MRIILLFLLISSNSLFSQSLKKDLNLGKQVLLEITPHGDRFTDYKWAHSYRIVKSDSVYLVVFKQENKVIRTHLSETDFKPFIKYIQKWRSKKSKYIGHSLDLLTLTIGENIEQFTASFKSDVQLIDIMHKNKKADPIKFGIK